MPGHPWAPIPSGFAILFTFPTAPQVILLLYVAHIVPVRLAFGQEVLMGSLVFWFETMVDVIFAIDIVLNFRAPIPPQAPRAFPSPSSSPPPYSLRACPDERTRDIVPTPATSTSLQQNQEEPSICEHNADTRRQAPLLWWSGRRATLSG